MKSLPTKERLQSGLAYLYEELQKKNNQQEADKLLDLLEKLQSQEWILSFSGHFSAGKSSLINRLLDQDLLPQSPIPTSANIVKVSTGNPGIKVSFTTGEIKTYPIDTDLETIQRLCRDGESIRAIDIIKPEGKMPANVSVVDTPGIDSTNDADRVITESSLHVVDILIYVMDYNHVQSEVNLKFLKEIQARNKPFYVVVNQIDKHQEKELSFSAFKNSVEDILASWKIEPLHVFYTSLFMENSDHNQWETLKLEIKRAMEEKETHILDTVNSSANWVMDSHIKKLKEQSEESHIDVSEISYESLKSELEEVNKVRDNLAALLPNLEKEYREIIDSTTKNALLTPYEVRNKAEHFLVAYQPDFKTGIFSTKKKIEGARKERKQAFNQVLQEKIKANLSWKIREKVTEFIKQTSELDTKYVEEISSLPVDYDQERLVAMIKSGARITPEYLLRYNEEVSNDIKMLYKQVYMDLWEKIKIPLVKEINAETETWNRKKKELEESIEQINKDIQSKKQLADYQTGLIAEFKEADNFSETIKKMNKIITDRQKKNSEPEKFQSVNKKEVKKNDDEKETMKTTDTQPVSNLSGLADRMKQAEGIFQELTGFDNLLQGLKEKRHRLNNKSFTVALFGAFSAGKSSFANALLGERVLPVSPNPTTAVINKISPPTNSNIHGTVVVKVKDELNLMSDLNSLRAEITGSTLDEKIANVKKILLSEKKSVSIHELNFLQAIIDGYSNLSGKLGKEIVIDYQDFSKYVVTESIACFLEWTELFYDCPLTRQGITIVDTPGADSINSRHTDVAFEYIKNADAILFVTYYNHAFSKADKDFLLQLGRVKDSFSLDKMFFIINASDLAKDHQELKMVEDYVAEQLIKFGIRKPRMFSLSSKLALEEKNDRKSGFSGFEKSFFYFLHNELAEILSLSAIRDINRGALQLDTYIHQASLDTKERERYAREANEKYAEVINKVKNYHSEGFEQEIHQKLDKQMYYVLERDSIQLNDRFKEFFNPTTVSASGSAVKTQLKENLNALLNETRYQLGQEIRAVMLRMEKYLNFKASELNGAMEEEVKRLEPGLSFFEWEERKLQFPEIREGFKNIEAGDFTNSLSIFKNKRDFFEKNEKEKMKESLISAILPHIETYLKKEKEKLSDSYSVQWNELQSEIRKKAFLSIDDFYRGVLASLEENQDIEELQKMSVDLKKILA